jgi:CheY-like chemotaxis protein
MILLAEDDAGVRTVASAWLERHGYVVVAAADGEEACRLVATHPGEFFAAVLDVVMPKRGGRDAARTIQTLRPGIPIVLCSGYPGAGDSSPDWIWLAKPYAPRELIRVLGRLHRTAPGGRGDGSGRDVSLTDR